MDRQRDRKMTTPLDKAGIRKAAILVASLDCAAGDLVLDRMAPDEAQRVRQVILDLGPLDPDEQRRVVDEFRGAPSAAPPHYPPGIELDGALAQMLGASATVDRPAEDFAPPFHFLRETETDKLARILISERPQVIALVLSHLPPEQAGDVLSRLSAAQQADVVRRLVDLGQPDPAILREVERGLESRLAEPVGGEQPPASGLPAVAGILKAAGRTAGRKLIENLAAHDPELVEQLGPPGLEFEDLAKLGQPGLQAVLTAAELDVVVLALVGLPPSRTDRFLGVLPAPEADSIRHQLAHLAPTRLSDVDEARHRLTELARHLAIEGRIEMPVDRPSLLLT
jgi:flagellar motor switch protein FliG